MSAKKILILGGSGFVGTWITSRLAVPGVELTIPTRRRERTKQLITLPAVKMPQENIHDPETLVRLMRGQDAVINLVGALHDRDSRYPYGKDFAAAHVELPQKIVAAMQKAGVSRLLHMSALNAGRDAPSEYLRSKGEGQEIVLAAQDKLDVTVFCPSVIFGLGDRFLTTFARALKLTPVFFVGGVTSRFQPVFIGDVANAFVDALSRSSTHGQVYHLCGPKIYTLRQLIEYAGEISGCPRPVYGLSPLFAYLQAGFLWCLPRPLMSPDNLRSMEIDNIGDGSCLYPAWEPTALEAVAPQYLGTAAPKARLNVFRLHARR
ncbi:MAG: complex I NDUFA9 subunit family protein [Betaproteobacteria bacterium]|nr:complex I NDUFA9 subunit family protein [Betaproteobacteria bacterium]